MSKRNGARWRSALGRAWGVLALLVFGVRAAVAASVTLAWDPVLSPSLSGYMLYQGPAAGSYPVKVDVGNRTTYTITGLTKGATYHFAVTAYNGSHVESSFSNDVAATAVLVRDVALYRKFVYGTSTPLNSYILDYNSNGSVDVKLAFGSGSTGDVPLVGNLIPGNKTNFVSYRNGKWSIDTNRDGTVDTVAWFGGVPGDIPLVANFSGAGQLDDLIIYRNGVWYVDMDLNGTANQTYMFGGVAGDVPLAGDVNGDGIADLAIYRNGIWYIDTNRNGTADMTVGFGGMPQDKPALIDWDDDGKADLCIFRNGVWYISTKRDGVADVIFQYGAAGDLPFIGQFH